MTISGVGIAYPDVVYNADGDSEGSDIEYYSPWGDDSNQSILEVKVDDGITEIGTGLFADCSNLKKVTLRSGIVSLGYRAFEDCRKLETVIGLRKDMINQFAFEGCISLDEETRKHIPPNTLRVSML